LLQLFEDGVQCNIKLQTPLTLNDVQELKKIFSKKYKLFTLEFIFLFNISKEILDLLYEEIIEKSKNIEIITYSYQLSLYLKNLGFKNSFNSLLKGKVFTSSKIEIILIGGSADSSKKILSFVKECTFEKLTLVIIQHVEPDRIGMFDEILQTYTKQKVSYAENGMLVEKGKIYIAPNNKHLKVENNCFILNDEEAYNFSKPSISISYESFSNEYKESLLVVQECGYGEDGVDKLASLIRNNSKLIIQNPLECKATPMVLNAIEKHLHHYVFTQKEISNYFNFLDKEYNFDEWLEYLLEKINEYYNYDFRLYYLQMIKRRLEFFIIRHHIVNIKDAVGMILFNKAVFKLFFLDISINVTEFFRYPDTFLEIAKTIEKSHNHNVKIWSAGCSNGKEVYSLAILFASLSLDEKLLIYATDFNNIILEEAKNGIYPIKDMEQASLNFGKMGLNDDFSNYIVKNELFLTINENIKNKILFFEHNLLIDASFNEFDIIICMNVLIYFRSNLQIKVLELFYNSLKFGGYLILGESEMIHGVMNDKFEKISKTCNIFKKVR
jgi:chemotaxis protein methyltransferase CheR